MAIEDLIAQGPTPPHMDPPGTALLRALAVRSAMQQQQLGQEQIQGGQIDLQEKAEQQQAHQAMNKLFAQSAQTGTQPSDEDVLKAGGIHAAPVIEQRLKMRQSTAALQETQNKNTQAEADLAGAAGAQINALGRTPEAVQSVMSTLPPNVRPHAVQILQSVNGDPGKFADALISGSEKVRTAAAAETTASARKTTADTTAKKTEAELPELQAKAEATIRQNAAAKLGAAKDANEYAQVLAGLPYGVAKDFEGKTPDQARQLGMTPDQQAVVQGQSTQRAETARHNKIDERLSGSRLNIEQQAQGLRQKQFDTTYGALLGPDGKPLEPEAAKAVASQDPLAVAVANYQVPPPPAGARGPGASIMRKALAIDPKYDGTKFPARNQTAKDYSASGASGKALTSADTALAHLATISKAGDALNNGDFKVINKIANELGVQVGKDPRNTYDTIVSMVAPEISKAVIGAAGGEAERQGMAQQFSSSLSQPVREKAIGAAVSLLGARVQKSAHAYESTMEKPLPWKLSPESQQVVQKYSGSGGTDSGTKNASFKVGDTVTYNGAPHKITAIKPNGKLVLDGQ